MIRTLVLVVLIVLVTLGSAGASTAPLTVVGTDGNGNQLIYDSVLNITWYDSPAVGRSWWDAKAWIATLNAAKLGGFDNWRLPQALPVNGSYYNWYYTPNGSTDLGFNMGTPDSAYPGSKASELAHLFYVTLENKGQYDVYGNPQSGGGLTNKGLFVNLEGYWYWTSTELGDSAVEFGPARGLQWIEPKSSTNIFTLAVAGDVTPLPPGPGPIPLPGAIWLLGPGIMGLAAVRRRLKR